MTAASRYSHRVVMSARGMLHLQWTEGHEGRTMCGRRVNGWTRSTAARWAQENALGSPFTCTQCRDPLGPNARIEL